MHIHEVTGVEIRSQEFGEGDARFCVHQAEFFSASRRASVEVAFFVEVGRRLTVNGGSNWGECLKGVRNIGRINIHLKGMQINSESTPSTTGGCIQNVYSNASCLLSYVTSVPVRVELSAMEAQNERH